MPRKAKDHRNLVEEAQEARSVNPAGEERSNADAAPEPSDGPDERKLQHDVDRAARLARGGKDAESAIQEQREADAERKREEVKAREQLLAQAAAPGENTENVLVVKRDALAARAEQERIDAGKEAASRQQPQPPPPPPPTEGTVPEEANPAHPFVPGPAGSAPHSEAMPAGPMDEDVTYVTDDIEPDGTPLIEGQAQGFVEPSPQINGEDDKEYPAPNNALAFNPDETPVKINQHSEEGARLDELKTGVRTVYVPTETALDPKSGNNTY